MFHKKRVASTSRVHRPCYPVKIVQFEEEPFGKYANHIIYASFWLKCSICSLVMPIFTGPIQVCSMWILLDAASFTLLCRHRPLLQ